MESNRNNNDRKAAQVNAALMHAAIKLLQEPPNPEEQYPTRCDAGYTPVVVTTTDDTPIVNNNAEDVPATSARAWHYTAMSAATFTLSALLAYIATEAICKRIRGRN